MGRDGREIVTRVDRSGRTCTSLEVAEFPHITSNGSLLLRRAELDSDARGMSGQARALVHGDSGAQSLQRNAGFRLFSPSPGTLNQGSISFQRVYRMNNPFTIGQLAAQADVPTSTVRYYERRGLVRCEGRTRSNYRQYGEATLERLRFIRSAQAAAVHARRYPVAPAVPRWRCRPLPAGAGTHRRTPRSRPARAGASARSRATAPAVEPRLPERRAHRSVRRDGPPWRGRGKRICKKQQSLLTLNHGSRCIMKEESTGGV